MYVYIEGSSPWLDAHLEAFIRHHDPDAIFVRDLANIPPSATSVFQYCCGQQLSSNFALLNKTRGLINAYPNSDALARKDHLAAVIDYWIAKRPDSILKDHVPQTVRLTLDYAEYVDEALMAADDLTLLASLEDNETRDPSEREWWILKPALVDCGAGIRIFSTIEELASHLERAEDEDEEEDEDEDSTSDSASDCALSHDGDADSSSLSSASEPAELKPSDPYSAFSPSLSLPGLSSLDLLVTTGPSTPTVPSTTTTTLRPKKPQYTFVAGGRIPSSQMRAFVAQRYLTSITPVDTRKWHVRAYVLAVGRLKVHVFREMLTLLAGEAYAPPWENPSLAASLTNTALQEESTLEERGSMRAFWEMGDDLFAGGEGGGGERERKRGGECWKEGLFKQICEISGEVFRAAAHTMADKFTTLERCFELFAVDYMVDAEGRAFLLEVNETPAFYQQGIAGGMAVRLMEAVVCVVMEHMGVSHVGEARNAKVRRRMVEVLDETGGLAKSNIVEVMADR